MMRGAHRPTKHSRTIPLPERDVESWASTGGGAHLAHSTRLHRNIGIFQCMCYPPRMEATSSVVDALKALADPVRLQILEFLWGPDAEEVRDEDGVCGKDVERFLAVTQPTVSYHMKILVGAGLVSAEKRGQKVYYECVTEGPAEVIRYLERYRTPKRADRPVG